MMVGETAYYWAHRLSHQIPFLWRFHAIHHSAEQLDFLVNTRMHPVDLVWSRMIMLTPIFALGLANPVRFGDGVDCDHRPPHPDRCGDISSIPTSAGGWGRSNGF